jgi:2-oxoglutarate ferredoxin oxidoreductase subunit delta
MPKVTFDAEACKGCALCADVCPRKILELDPAAINAKGYHPAHCVDQTQCTGCASCARMCPDVVITVER